MARTAERPALRPLAATGLVLTLIGAVAVAPPASAAPGGSPPPTRICGPGAPTIEPVSTSGPRPSLPLSTIAPGAPTGFHAGVDMDDDGIDDVVTGPAAGSVTVLRGDGLLTVTDLPTGPDPLFGGEGIDLDGDGRDELVLTRTTGSGSSQVTELWVVPGTTPTGTTSIDDIGVATTGSIVGDVDGDGLDDLVLRSDLFVVPLTSWVSGAEALAAASGGPVAASVDPIGALVDLDFDGQPDLVRLGSPDGSVAPSIEFSTGGTAVLPEGPHTVVGADRSGSATYVQLTRVLPPPAELLRVIAVRVRNACSAAWMTSMVPLLLDRPLAVGDHPSFAPNADPTRLERFVRMYGLLRSEEARGVLVDDRFEWLLGRPADPSGRAYWVRVLRSGHRTPEHLAASMLGSPERYRRSGGTDAGWVTDAFQRALGRAPDPGGLGYWTRQVGTLGPERTAARMLATTEARRAIVRRYAESDLVLGDEVEVWHLTDGVADMATGGLDLMLLRLLIDDAVYLRAQSRNVFG